VADEERQIDESLQDMIRHGVRALLVTREDRVTGLITSYDIQGEKPLQFLQNSNYRRHQDICVGHMHDGAAPLARSICRYCAPLVRSTCCAISTRTI
jgi:CBS-domain-containing membrane protein